MWQHVESKVAAIIRREGTNEAELVINNIPCGNTREVSAAANPYSCERILPAILPAGTRLTVWVTPDSGRTWLRGTYHGTGERIRP